MVSDCGSHHHVHDGYSNHDQNGCVRETPAGERTEWLWPRRMKKRFDAANRHQEMDAMDEMDEVERVTDSMFCKF